VTAERLVLTNASLMVGGAAAAQAAALARENPRLAVGLHLTLTRGRAALSPEAAGGLTDEEGRFARDPVRAGLAYFFNRGLRAPLLRECSAQIEAFLDAGLSLSHIDGHLNMHMHPSVVCILADGGWKYLSAGFWEADDVEAAMERSVWW